MTDRLGSIVGGFTVAPAHRQTGDVIGMSVFTLQCEPDQAIQYIGDGKREK